MGKRGENIYKRKDGRWEARVLKGYNEQSKALYAYFYGRSYKEAKEKVFMSLPYVKESPFKTSSSDFLIFECVLDSWLENSKIKLKGSSYVKYHNIINNHIKPLLGKHLLININSTLLNTYIAEKLKSGKLNESGGLSEKTVKDIMSVIKSALSFAKNESLPVDENINLTLPREKNKDMRVLSKDEQATLEKYLSSELNESKLGIFLCLYTGLRVGEVCALKWSDISIESGTLTVNRTMQRIQTLDDDSSTKTKIFVAEPKSGSSTRTIPLPDCLIDKLTRFLPTNTNAYFLTGTNRYIEPRTYQNHFKSYIADSGIKVANFHSTRHTFATRCVELGFEIKSLSEILGHSSIKITLDRYVHPSIDLKRNNMNKLNLF